ncbi:MAG: hypothetical protein HKN81_08470 [Gammaproteobacteria bacterium]|nr:hypothetical protein [Gammaproteobacteria bacterium]
MNESEESDSEFAEPAVRAPEGIVETLIVNFRPQPAIPAVFVLFLTVLVAVFTFDPDAERGILILLAPVGILASCGLAIAAGFCSLFPQAIWILIAAWALKFTNTGPLPPYNRYVLFAGMFACAVMFVAQIWRVRIGRFVPTIRIDED